jgi:DNA invertase Pin-like site-specific DNA recombinase
MSKKIVGYVRVSTKEQGKSGLGLQAQREALQQWAAAKGYDLVHVFEEVISGAVPVDGRIMLSRAFKLAAKHKATVAVNRLDRLSRDAEVLLHLSKAKTPIVALNLGEDVDKFMFGIHAVVAERERVLISIRTKEALSVLKAQGKKLGNPNIEDRITDDGRVVKGIHTSLAMARTKVTSDADDFAKNMRPAIERMQRQGMSLRKIAAEFNANGTRTARGGDWTSTTVKNITARWAE